MTRIDDCDNPVSPACLPTVDRLQLVLDGELNAAALHADPHSVVCAACRDRIAAARLLLSTLATPPEPVALPAERTDAILSAVRDDRQTRLRRRTYAVAVAACVALVAPVLLMKWLQPAPSPPEDDLPRISEVANVPPAPEPRPVRIGDELSKAGQALRGSSKPLTEPAAAAPGLLAKLTGTLTRPALPATQFDPGSLGELSEAARVGLEPVTGTAQKAFARLMRDVSGVSTKPKS